MILSKSETAFLVGLAELTRKTGISVDGCGCCGSPFLVKVDITSDESGYSFDDQVVWTDPSDDYNWEKLSCKIVRKDKT